MRPGRCKTTDVGSEIGKLRGNLEGRKIDISIYFNDISS